MKWAKVTALAAVFLIGAVFIGGTLFSFFGLPIHEAGAIGIIGAADGPTAIFFTTTKFTPHMGLLIGLALVVITAELALFFTLRKR